MDLANVSVRMLAAGFLTFIAGGTAGTQPAPGPAPAVGIVEAIRRPITETNEFLGRIGAVNRVNVVARVTAFLEQRLFVEGAELRKGDPLYRLERGPFEADLASKAAQAQVDASQINLDYTVISTPIDGKIGRTAVTEGNVVGPSSGVLTTIVSQDPMYVTFPAPLGLLVASRSPPLRVAVEVTVGDPFADGKRQSCASAVTLQSILL